MKEHIGRTAAEATMLTMMKILKTMNKTIAYIIMKELSIAIGSLKKGKSADSKGINAEDLKGS